MNLKLAFFILFISINAFAESTESEKIYNSVLKATFTKDKIQVAKSFLKLGECKKGEWTLKLLKDSHYWNREAGIFLASECKNPKLDQEVCDLFLRDHMTRRAVRKVIQKNPERFSTILISKYKKELWSPTKKDLFSLYELTQDTNTSNFLQSVISEPNSPDRVIAFKALMNHSKRPNSSYFRSFLEDKELRKFSLQLILETGNEKDLSLFQDILSNSESEKSDLAIACMAIQKWGDSFEKKTNYLRFLREDDQSLLPSAFSIFNGLMDDEIFSEISKLSRTGKTQTIRTEAILQLKNSKNINKIPYIILFLQEDYQTQTKHHIGDVVATVITFGIHGIFKGIRENRKRQKFRSIQFQLNKHLQEETGEKITDPKEWKIWANKKKLLPITITYD